MRTGWLLLSVIVGIPSPAFADVTWVGDFETGDTSQYGFLLNPDVGGVDYISVGTDPVVQGTYAARIELHDDARWSNGLRRVELQHRPEDALTAEGAEVYFAWSFLVPETLPTDPSQTIGYWESRMSFQQMMAFRLQGEDLTFVTRRPSNVVQWTGEGVVTPGVWHRIAMRVAWAKDEADGSVDVWFDGTKVVDAASAQTLADDNPHFVQFGLLRGDMDFADVPVIYIDDAVEGEALADVRPELMPTAMPDAGTVVDPDAGTMAMPDAGGGGVDSGTPSVDSGGPSMESGDDGGCSVTSRGKWSDAPLSIAAILLCVQARRRRL